MTEDAPTCDEVLNACDAALEAREKELNLSNLALRQQTDRVFMLEAEVKDKESALSAWYRNPYLLIGLGLVGGAMIAR